MKRRWVLPLLFASAYGLGAVSVLLASVYKNRDTVVYTTTTPLVAKHMSGGFLRGEILIPEGIELVHDHYMSEGFDTLRLYLNVDGAVLNGCFDRRVDDRPGLVIPYWVAKAEN